ncbi:MAG: discoidin domain-containing protein, partial [Propionicimonas sp.]
SSTNYSLREIEARNGADGTNVITPTMTATERISGATANLPKNAIDGNINTYWTAASTGGTAASDTDWWQVDLGADTALDRVVLDWGTQPAAAYAIQVSSDGVTWQPMTYYGIPSSVSVFPQSDVRYVRYQGVAPNTSYGYSIREIEVHNGEDGADLAQQAGVVATASSWGSTLSPQRPVSAALDGNFGTWWSVEKDKRSQADSWYQLDLGSLQPVDRVVVYQETKPVAYEIQISADGQAWRTVDFQAPGAARVDSAVFDNPVEARYVRMQGEVGNPQYGYSLYEFQAFNGASGSNLANGKAVTASSADASKTAALATDGKFDTRWAVATADRGVGDTWVQVDLGSAQTIDRARLVWETAGLSYYVQTSLDGEHWTNQFEYNAGSSVATDGGWLTVDDRASFVVSGSENPIQVVSGGAVSVDRITLSAGSAAGSAGMVVEGYAKTGAAKAADLSARTRATSANPDLTVSDANGYLSLFNLGSADAATDVSIPTSGARRLDQGTQAVVAGGTRLAVSVPAASSRVLPALFTVTGDTDGLVAEVVNGRRVKLTATASGSVTLTPRTGEALTVDLVAGTQTVEFAATTRPYPLADLAAGKTSYPSSPLPAGMTDPDLALDDDVATVWVPGSADGRLVVDLGAETDLGTARVIWDGKAAPAAVLSGSLDGITFTEIGQVAAGVVSENSLTGTRARYLALQVSGWQSQNASLATLAVYPAGADPVQLADELQLPMAAADKAALQATVATAGALVETDYTTSSWAEADLASVLATARAVLDDAWAIQAEVDAATTALGDAIGLLATRGDAQTLTSFVVVADALDGKLDGFTDESVSAFTAALAQAKAVAAAADDKTQADLDAATAALQAALSGLTAKPVVVDKAVLQEVHDTAAALSNSDGRFTTASWSKLQAAVTGALGVLDDESATQDEVDDAVTTLTVALSQLAPVVDTAVLRSVLDSATALTNP